ncbi:hypothetical protein D3C86_2207000 [compost metagenome]
MGISLAMKPIWNLIVMDAPASKVTLLVKTPLLAVIPSPLSLGYSFVNLFLTSMLPVNSVLSDVGVVA